jgi:HEAT repeat protein
LERVPERDVGPDGLHLPSLVRDADPNVSRTATGALEALKDPSAVPGLIEFLIEARRDADPNVYRAAAECLELLKRRAARGD